MPDDTAAQLAEVAHLLLAAHKAEAAHAKAQLTRFRRMAEIVTGIDGQFRAERAAELDAEAAERHAARERSRIRAVA